MRRRDFIAGASSLCCVVAAQAKPPDLMRGIGLIMPSRAEDVRGQRQLKKFTSELERTGWSDGRNVSLFVRWSGGEPSLAKTYADELVRLRPDVIVAGSTIGLEAARSATSTIPIVFVAVSDPVAAGYVQTLARPGSNITGFSSFDIETGGKWLQILKELVPNVSRVGVLMDPDYAGYMARWRGMAKLGPAFGVELVVAAIRARTDIQPAISGFAEQQNGALIVFSSALTSANSDLITSVTAKYRSPTIYPFVFFVKKGGLISYGIDTVDLFGRSASYVDRILKGAKPADLPVQQPTKFEMAINLKTAKSLGLTVPYSLLVRADEVIE